MMLPTQERLKELIHYDPESGEIRWRMRPGPNSRAKAGDNAIITGKSGTILIYIDGTSYVPARVVFLYMTGAAPHSRFIKFEDGDKANLRWKNLSHNTPIWSSQQPERPFVDCDGVLRNGGKWDVTIELDGQSIYIGRYHTREVAVAAYHVAMEERRPAKLTTRNL